MITDWGGVRQRVLALRELPRSDRLFGGSGHRFVLSAPLPDAAVREAEQELGAVFPDAYRTFLTEVGAGGAGPGYGLLTLSSANGCWQWIGNDAKPPSNTNLTVPFVHRDLFHLPEWPELGDYPERAQFTTDAQYDAAVADRARVVDTLDAGDVAATFGTIALSHLGCNYYSRLVVNGPDRGVVWSDFEAADGGIFPLVDEVGKVTFDRWYLSWLEAAETGQPERP